MKVLNNYIVSATRSELWNEYLKDEGKYELYSFEEYLFRMRLKGVKIIDERKNNAANQTVHSNH